MARDSSVLYRVERPGDSYIEKRIVPDLSFRIANAEAQKYAAAPLLVFKLEITNAESEQAIHTIALRCQIQIEATRRHYSQPEQEKLLDLFGEPSRWSQTLRTMLWTHTSTIVQPFTGSTIVDLPVPCTFDFTVAATKYFTALEDGEVPLCLQFSGTCFYANEAGALQVTQIPWSAETKYRLPIHVWQAMMDFYYPNSVWLSLRRDVFDRLHQYKMQRGIPTWEQLFAALLGAEEKEQ